MNGEAVRLEMDDVFPFANKLAFTLLIIREKFRRLEQRDLILFTDIYPRDVIELRHKEPYIHFFKFRILWREA